MEQKNNQDEKRGWKVYIPVAAVIIFIVVGGWYWYLDYSRYISTDDAYVDSDRVALGSKILGRVAKTYVIEGDSVSQGMLLAEIDSTELSAQKLQTIAARNQAEASIVQAQAKLNLDEESINVQKINLQKAKDDLSRAKIQFDGNVITKEQYEHAQKTNEAAQAQLNTAQTQITVSKSQIASAQASIASAQAQIGLTVAQLHNTKIYAPFSGVVSKRWLLAGDIAQPGQSIYTITNDRKLWVTIYIEETKLSEIHVGQKALFEVDAYPNIKYSGAVFYIGANTASQFSLIPPSNASGNFTKITQRVPVKISIDKAENKKGEATPIHLVSGMSVVMKLVK